MKAIAMRPTRWSSRALDCWPSDGRAPWRGARAGRGRLVQAGRPRRARVARRSGSCASCGARASTVAYHDPLVARSRSTSSWRCCRCRGRDPGDYDLALMVTVHDGRRLRLARRRLRPRARLHLPDAARRTRSAVCERPARLAPATDPVVQPRAARGVRALPGRDRDRRCIAYKTVFIEVVDATRGSASTASSCAPTS